MNTIWQAIGGLFSISSMISFLAGVAGTILFYRVEDKWVKDHQSGEEKPPVHKLRSLWILWSLVFVITGYIGFQEHETAESVRTLSRQTQDCQRQFQETLKIRSDAGDAQDEWARRKSQAIGGWLRDILFPPEDIARLRNENPNDPRYQQWAITVTSKYLGLIDEAEKEQEAAMKERQEHPYPEPTCGK